MQVSGFFHLKHTIQNLKVGVVLMVGECFYTFPPNPLPLRGLILWGVVGR